MKRSLLIAGILIFSLLVCGCTASNSNVSRDTLPQDKYVAVEEYMQTSCTIINGSYNFPPHITLPPISFDYNGSDNGSNPADGNSWYGFHRFISNDYYPAVNDSFKALYDSTYYRDVAPLDTRTGMIIKGIYRYPYVFESGFVLNNIDGNGTLYGSYNNTSIVIRSGEQWTSPLSTEIKGGSGTDLSQKPYSYTASFNTTITIMNLGVLDKLNLTRYNNSNTDTGYSQLS
jgi:hypothetical protein